MVREAQDLVFLSVFLILAIVLIFQLIVDQRALVCVSTHLHQCLRVHENHVLSYYRPNFLGVLDVWKGIVSSEHDVI